MTDVVHLYTACSDLVVRPSRVTCTHQLVIIVLCHPTILFFSDRAACVRACVRTSLSISLSLVEAGLVGIEAKAKGCSGNIDVKMKHIIYSSHARLFFRAGVYLVPGMYVCM